MIGKILIRIFPIPRHDSVRSLVLCAAAVGRRTPRLFRTFVLSRICLKHAAVFGKRIIISDGPGGGSGRASPARVGRPAGRHPGPDVLSYFRRFGVDTFLYFYFFIKLQNGPGGGSSRAASRPARAAVPARPRPGPVRS